MRILDIILTYDYYLMLLSFLITLYGGSLLIYNRYWKYDYSYKRTMVGAILVLQSFFCVFGLLRLELYFITKARQELRAVLDQPDLIVRINRYDVGDKQSQEIIDELKYSGFNKSTRSRPTKKDVLQIIDENNTIILTARRDSKDKTDYYIYYHGYSFTKNSSIGRIKTTSLIL
ncbi:hypothetical protein JKA74_13955 [Marivirga sp. S37H4]|uniref:Uncharacterized protein n=1 Tax=Marivirga aurantiaca TaxID=2802615 RepID=A0A934WZM0_9BACT|nr:hypothetical protein [Marivirga aurantiaca]MBK6266144.1 hypothetical protein [Marivirga aurantiaca]